MPDGVKAGTAYVDVDADLAKLKKTVDQGIPQAIDGAAQKGAQQAGSRFAGIGGHLKKGILGSLGGVSGIAVGGGITAIGASLDALAGPAEQAKKQLEAAFSASGFKIDEFKGRIASTERQMENYGHTNADTDTALRKLTTAFQDPAKALKEMGLVANIAAAQHISLADAAALDIKAHGGASKVFKQFGISIADAGRSEKELAKAQKEVNRTTTALAKAQKAQVDFETHLHFKKKITADDYLHELQLQHNTANAVDDHTAALGWLQIAQKGVHSKQADINTALGELAKRVKGQAGAAVDSFSGKLEVWKTKIQDVAAKWGAKLGPILTAAGPLIAGLGGILSSGLVPSLGATATAEEATGVATTSMLGPIALIIAAIAALVAGVIYAYNHWTGFRNVVDAVGRWLRDVLWPIIQRVAMDIWNVFKIYLGFLKLEWQVLWAVIKWVWENIGSPIFDSIKTIVQTMVAVFSFELGIAQAVFSALWGAVQSAWENVGHPVFHAVSVVVGAMASAFEWAKDHVVAAWNWIGDKISSIYNSTIKPIIDTITGAIGIISNFLGGSGNGPVSTSLRGAALHGQPIGFGPPPKVHAAGGIFTQPHYGLVAEAGPEAIVPLTRPARARQILDAAGLGGHTTNNFYMTAGMTADQILAARRREERLLANV